MILHGCFRSSAAFRVRIAFNLKGVAVEQRYIRLRKASSMRKAFLGLNPLGLVPVWGGRRGAHAVDSEH